MPSAGTASAHVSWATSRTSSDVVGDHQGELSEAVYYLGVDHQGELSAASAHVSWATSRTSSDVVGDHQGELSEAGAGGSVSRKRIANL